jgi:hypothetical protein
VAAAPFRRTGGGRGEGREESGREGEEWYLSVLASARSGEGEGEGEVEVGSRGEEKRLLGSPRRNKKGQR